MNPFFCLGQTYIVLWMFGNVWRFRCVLSVFWRHFRLPFRYFSCVWKRSWVHVVATYVRPGPLQNILGEFVFSRDSFLHLVGVILSRCLCNSPFEIKFVNYSFEYKCWVICLNCPCKLPLFLKIPFSQGHTGAHLLKNCFIWKLINQHETKQ